MTMLANGLLARPQDGCSGVVVCSDGDIVESDLVLGSELKSDIMLLFNVCNSGWAAQLAQYSGSDALELV